VIKVSTRGDIKRCSVG